MNFYLRLHPFFIFIILIVFSKQNISSGITKIINNSLAACISDANEKYINILTNNKRYVVNKEDNSIKHQKDIDWFFPPFLLYMYKSKNYFLLTERLRYCINLNEENEFYDLGDADSILDIDFYYIGYILEKTLRDDFDEFDIIDSVIYGLKYNGIYLNSTSNSNFYKYESRYDVDFDKINLSCKQIRNKDIICISSMNFELETKFILCMDETWQEIQFTNVGFSNFYDGFIYDTLKTNIKFFCAKIDELMNCANLIIEEKNNNYEFSFDEFISLPEKYNYNCRFNYCDFTVFLSEYLFCCPCNNYL